MRSVIWGSPSVTSNTTMDPTNLKVTSGFLSFKKVRCESKNIYTCLIPWSSNCNKKTRSRGAVFRKRSKNDASYWSHLRLTTAKGCPCYKYHKGAPFEPLFFFRGEPPGYSKLGMWSGMVMPLSMDLCGLPESKRMEPAVVLVHDMCVSKSERFPMPSKKWLITQHYAYMTIFHNSTTRIVYGNSLVFSVMFVITPNIHHDVLHHPLPAPCVLPCFAMATAGGVSRNPRSRMMLRQAAVVVTIKVTCFWRWLELMENKHQPVMNLPETQTWSCWKMIGYEEIPVKFQKGIQKWHENMSWCYVIFFLGVFVFHFP